MGRSEHIIPEESQLCDSTKILILIEGGKYGRVGEYV